jgi:hypothetical protein
MEKKPANQSAKQGEMKKKERINHHQHPKQGTMLSSMHDSLL